MKAEDVVVTAHQLNFAPGCSVVDRLRQADIVIWLDAAQYVRHGFVNRNRLSDGSWMTIPVNEHDTYAPINRVRIADPTGRAREKVARHLEHRLGEKAARFARELRHPYELLVGLNHAIVLELFAELGIGIEHRYQTFLDPEHGSMPVVGEDDEQVTLVRDRYAAMAEQLGATVYLSGPQAHHGDAASFADRGIRIEYTERWEKPNPSALELVVNPLMEEAA